MPYLRVQRDGIWELGKEAGVKTLKAGMGPGGYPPSPGIKIGHWPAGFQQLRPAGGSRPTPGFNLQPRAAS